MGVDVGSNEETNNVEERYPNVLGQELLGEGQGQGGGDPAHLHDGHETGLDGRTDLVNGARTGNNSHGGQVDAVLNGGDLNRQALASRKGGQARGGMKVASTRHTIRLLTRI